MQVLYGRKTILMPFDPEQEMQHFLDLLDDNSQLLGDCFFKSKEAYLAWVISEIKLGRWLIWSCWSKSGMAESTKRFGFIVLFDPSPMSVSVQGLMDKSIMRGLLKLLHNHKTLTMTEDCLNTLVNHAFEIGIHRLDATAFESNITSRRLMEKCGFRHEGRSREAGVINGARESIHLYGLLKSDLENRSTNEDQQGQHRGINSSLHAAGV